MEMLTAFLSHGPGSMDTLSPAYGLKVCFGNVL